MRSSRLRSRITGPIAFAAVVAVVLSCGEIREGEMLCEEAVSHLDECCPDIDPRRLNCIYQDGCGTDLKPIFTIKASDCLRDRPCDVLMEKGRDLIDSAADLIRERPLAAFGVAFAAGWIISRLGRSEK